MTNDTSDINTGIKVNGQKLETVTSFKNLGSVIADAQGKGEEDKAVRGRNGKTTSGNGQAWSSASSRGQWRTGKNRENWLQNHLWCPNDPRG